MSKHSILFSLTLSLLSALSLGSCADIDNADTEKGNSNGRILKIMAKVNKPQTTRVSSNEQWLYNYEDSTYTKWQEFQWDSGDEIALIGSDGSVATYRTEGDGTFTAVDGGLHMADGQIRAVYPASGSVGANQLCFIGDTWVSEGQEQADITFNPLSSKVNIRTYTEDGSYPVDIQPILYGISSEGYFDINSFTLSSGWPDSIKFENSNTFIPDPSGYQPLKKKDCKIYTSYESLVVPNSGDYWNNGNSCRLKYSLYGIFDIEKTIPEKLQAGTEYDIMLKVPKEPTFEIEDYRNKIVTIKMPIPHGFSMDNINRDDYEVEISSSCYGFDTRESWKMSLPETITDSVLSFTVNPKRLHSGDNTGTLYMYSIFINKKNHENDSMEEVFSLGCIGSNAAPMSGSWQGTESWKDWEDETDHTKTYNIDIWTEVYTATRIWSGPFPREGTRIWMFGNEVKIVYWRPEDGDNKLYILSGTVDNPAYPTSFQGTFLRGDTQTWQVDYSHEFNMKKISN